MSFAVSIVFKAFAKGLKINNDIFKKLHFWFIGTSYAPAGCGKKTIQPIAAENNIDSYVTEVTDRIPYFETLYLLDKADLLFIPGSTDISYTASKIYPYIMLQKKMLAVFNKNSSVVNMLHQLQYGELIAFDHTVKAADEYVEDCFQRMCKLLSAEYSNKLDYDLFEPYKAFSKTKEQVDFFNEVIRINSIAN